MAKSRAKPRTAAKVKPRRQMTVALAEKHALGWADGCKIDSLALLRSSALEKAGDLLRGHLLVGEFCGPQ